MRRIRLFNLIALMTLAAVAVASPAAAKDQVSGTFTVKGKTTTFRQVYGTLDKDPESETQKYLVLLLSDVPIAEVDRRSERLKDLAARGQIHALKITLPLGLDTLRAVPYHQAIPDSGTVSPDHPTMDLRKLNDELVDATVQSKMLGQDWHFSARLQADLRAGGVFESDPEPAETTADSSAPAGGGTADPTAMKRALGRLGYEFKEEPFTRAVKDGNVEAVKLFLQLGQSPNVKDDSGTPVMISAASFCSYPPPDARTGVILALLAAKGDPNAKDQNQSTPLIWAAQSCELAAVEALIKAGGNVNAKAAGGGTPMMLATVFKRTDVMEALRRAGAK